MRNVWLKLVDEPRPGARTRSRIAADATDPGVGSGD